MHLFAYTISVPTFGFHVASLNSEILPNFQSYYLATLFGSIMHHISGVMLEAR